MSVVPQQQPETEVVTGTIIGITQKGPDKWQVQVDVGRANPRGLWTKDTNLVAQLSMMIGQQQSFLCGISNWVNQQTGAPVRSLWVNGVGPPGGVQQPAPPPQQPQAFVQQTPTTMPIPQAQPMQPVVTQPPVARVTEDMREKRIMRQTATKVASILISHVPGEDRNLGNVLALSERLVAYYENGVQWEQGQDGNPDPGPQEIPHTDDDIPF